MRVGSKRVAAETQEDRIGERKRKKVHGGVCVEREGATKRKTREVNI